VTPGLQVTTPTDTEIVLSRAFDAPRRLVFDALTTPELLKRWLGAHGWNLVVCEIDLRIGGAWRFVSEGPGGAEMGHGGVYREIARPGRLAYTESYDDQWFPGESLVRTELAEQDGTTTLTTTVTYPSREVRDIALRSPMEQGVADGFDRLDAVLQELQKGDVTMNWTLEVIIVPVADVDRAKAFYADQLGFNLDHDSRFGEGRVVQLTPPGSGCSVVIGTGVVPEMTPGSIKGLQLVVPDIHKAHAFLVERGVNVSDVQAVTGDTEALARGGTALDNIGFVYFDDPDGNSWAVQQISSRG
jgi:uncharacterized protein YndB with AHSA1/START domain/catechol 2,3-dioxygenase-like lactoylglutathione lyase family enzyme